MAGNRLEVLRSMLEQDPTNAFARYGVAMELANAGDLSSAVEAYETLIAGNPAYVAAYFHGGQTLEKLGRVEDARALYRRGLDACTIKGDMHTRSEIQAALDLLG